MVFPIFDAHCDTLDLLCNGVDLYGGQTEVSFPMMQRFPAWTQVFAIWVDGQTTDPIARYELLLGRYREKTGMFAPVLTQSDLRGDFKHKKILSVEGGEVLCGDISRLHTLYGDGVRAITLTWNGPNEIADTAAQPQKNGGLTPFGREVVKEMNRLGMAVDVSHLSDNGFWDVIALSTRPVLVSHSNARALCDHPRNLTDDMFAALIRGGGVLGINFYPAFLGENADIDTVISHIQHFVSLGGEDHIGLGSDFDGTDGCLPKGIRNCGHIGDLLFALHEKGFSDTWIEKFAHGNMERFFNAVLPA